MASAMVVKRASGTKGGHKVKRIALCTGLQPFQWDFSNAASN